MKKLILTAIILLFPFICLASFDISKWKFFKELGAINGDLIRVILDDEIFRSSKDNLADLRVVDKNNKEIPFKIISGVQQQKKIDYPLQIINNSFVLGQYSSVILDLGEKGKIINNLNIITSSENFQRNVIISGSDDMYNWSVLNDHAYIYDFTDKKASFKAQGTKLSFPDSLFRYLKIEISDDENSPIKIISVTASQIVSEPQREFRRTPNFSASENSENKTTEIIADLGQSGMPTNKILLETLEPNFNRGVVVSSSNDKNNWKTLGQGYIFRYSTGRFNGENLLINYTEDNSRYIKIEIFNKDNNPLSVTNLSVFSIYRELVFQADKNNQYRIFYGNEKASYPEYDLEKYFQYLDIGSSQLASLSLQKDNPDYIAEKEPQKPVSERLPYLLPGILITTSLFILIMVYKFLKNSHF